MSFDRTEAAGFGVAVAGHAALFAALALGISAVQEAPPMPPAMEVSFAEDVGVQTSGATTEPTAQSFAPEAGPPEEAAPAPAPEPTPPQPQPVARQAAPAPQQRPTPPQPQRAAPAPAQRQAQAAPAPNRGTGDARTNRGSALGPDILKGLGSDPASRNTQSSGAVMSARALADIGSAIHRQVQPCADRQRSPGPGAERIRVTIRLRLNRNGSLAAPPTVVGRVGVDDENRRYADRVDDLAIATFAGCSPLRGLPDELYDVPNGWRDFRLRFKLPG